MIEYVYRRYPLSRYRRGDQIFIAGDVFFANDSDGILYVALQISEIDLRRLKSPTDIKAPLEVGFLGDSDGAKEIEDFVHTILDVLGETGLTLDWEPKHYRNPQFDELSNSEETQFIPASTIPSDDLNLAALLENVEIRDLAITIRRAGGILFSDISRKSRAPHLDIQKTIKKLVDAGLLSQEYVVICKKRQIKLIELTRGEKLKKWLNWALNVRAVDLLLMSVLKN